MYCRNCGKKGHLYKDCNEPNISCGVILYRYHNSEYELLMIERKDSFCYMDIIRGKYTLENIDHLKLLFSRCSKIELHNLRNKTFINLWYNLWKKKDAPCNLNEENLTNEYKLSKEKFLKLKKGFYNKNDYINIDNLIETINPIFNTPEWEFPKGKRLNNENNKDCAKRELIEETNITEKDFIIYKNVIPYSENILGENNIRYKNIYYLGMCIDNKNIKIDVTNKNQYYEVNNVKFMNKSHALNSIREYDKTKYLLIDKIFNFLNNDLNNYIIKY